jgi:Rrf2 family protein
MFSKACEYGIRAAIYIAGQSVKGRKVSLKEIASEIRSPEAYTSKILQKLSKGEVILSEKGPTGGFSIEPEKLHRITLKNVVVAVDGDKIFTGCGLGLTHCSETKPCPMHNSFKVVRDELHTMLSTKTIFHLSESVEAGGFYLVR